MESLNRSPKPRPWRAWRTKKRRRLKQKEEVFRISVRWNGPETKESFGKQRIAVKRCLEDSSYYNESIEWWEGRVG